MRFKNVLLIPLQNVRSAYSYQSEFNIILRQHNIYRRHKAYAQLSVAKFTLLKLISFCRCPQSCTTSFLMLHILMLSLLHAGNAAPQNSCILCDNNDIQIKAPKSASNYEEFLFEHQVSKQDAINALKTFNETFAGNYNENSCKTVICTKQVMRYCLGPQFINDHCWCELGHSEEGLPFVPHICYVGEKIYKASVGSCFFYEEVKECCCAAALAKQWRHISGAALTIKAFTKMLTLFLLAFILLLLF